MAKTERKKSFKTTYGFWPHQEACTECPDNRTDHNVWNENWNGHEFVSYDPPRKVENGRRNR